MRKMTNNLYNKKFNCELGKLQNNDFYLKDYDTLFIPAIRNEQSVWHQRFSMDYLKDLESRVGKQKFASQMMLEPPKHTSGYFSSYIKEELFQSGQIQKIERNFTPMLTLNDKIFTKSIAYWDPSSGQNVSDGSVLIIAYIDEKSQYFINTVEYINHKVSNSSDVMEQIDVVIDILKQNFSPIIYIETNGIGKFIPELMKKELMKKLLKVKIEPIHNKSSKTIRIIEGLEGALSANFIKFNQNLKNTQLFTELNNWNPYNGFKDDCLDALSGIMLNPAHKISFTKQKSYTSLNKIYKVKI